jgi:hypothetical protein
MYSSVCGGQVPYWNDAKGNDVHSNLPIPVVLWIKQNNAIDSVRHYVAAQMKMV